MPETHNEMEWNRWMDFILKQDVFPAKWRPCLGD